MGDRDIPILRPPRRTRSAEALLAGRLQPGEGVRVTFRVLTGSVWAYAAVSLPALVLWIVGLNMVGGDRLSEGMLSGVRILGIFAIILVSYWRFMKPRLLALTDLRLFVSTMSLPFERLVGVETEARREDLHIVSEGWGRLLVADATGRRLKLRIPTHDRQMIGHVKNWVETASPERGRGGVSG